MPHLKGETLAPWQICLFPVFPQRCDAPPELPRATAESTSADASVERGNAGPDGKSHLRDSSKQWDLVKSGRSQKLGKRKREDSKDAARLAEAMEMSGPSVTRIDASFETGNVGPDGNSHLRDSSKQWDLVKLRRRQKLGKRKREESEDAAMLAEPMEISGPSEFER